MAREILERANNWASLKTYQHPGGFLNNTFGRLALLRARRAYDGSNNFSLPDQIHYPLGQPYSEDFISELKSVVDKGLESDAASKSKAGDAVSQKYVSSLDFAFEEHLDLSRIFPDEVRKDIEEYYGCGFAVEEMKAWRSFHVPEDERDKVGSSTYNWHIGDHSPASIKFFILLSDVTEEHGPTEISLSPLTSFSREDRDMYTYTDVEPDNTRKLTGMKGDAYIFAHERVLHRASYVAKGKTREAVFFRIAPAKKSLEKDWYDREPYTSQNVDRCTSGVSQFFKM